METTSEAPCETKAGGIGLLGPTLRVQFTSRAFFDDSGMCHVN